MSRQLHPAYRFATEAQWQTCHFAGADRRTATARRGMRPFAPFQLPPTRLWDSEAYAPAISQELKFIWRGKDHLLWTLPYPDEVPTETSAPSGIASAKRLVAGPDMLWAVGADGKVDAFDAETLVRIFQADLGQFVAVDIASDSGDGAYVLGRSDGQVRVVHLGCSGNVDGMIALDEVEEASGLVFLGIPHRLVVLASAKSKLHFVDAKSGKVVRTVHLSALRGCFEVSAIGSDRCSRFFVAGADRIPTDGKHRVLIVDEEGTLLGTMPVDKEERLPGTTPVDDEVTGIDANRSQLFLTTKKGVLRFNPASTVPQGIGEVQALLVTPQLQSPATGAQKWIRVDAKVNLPAGCSIRISHASAASLDMRKKAEEALVDPGLMPGQRLAKWRNAVVTRTYTYHGHSGESGEVTLSAPLHDVRDELIWIEVALIAAPGGRLPALSELRILYPGATLLEHLPSIYRSGELTSGDFTRALVGVLEAGTQELDEKIGKLGQKIHPKSAEGAWLDYVASWLGLPWDNGLSVEQKRSIVSRGAAIAQGYSTRAGLEELLECLMPGTPPRFRVTDITADFGLATIAGRGCEGSRLPAVLAGLPATATELGNKAVLGKARLPCGEPEPGYAKLLGRVRIDIAATAEEQAAWSPWLARLVETMLPAAVRADIRWLGPAELRRGRIDDNSKIEDEPAGRLGTDAVTGASRLGGRARTILPSKLTQNSTLQ